METTRALDAFNALSQDTRLAALRLLVKAGPGGLAAGAIAEQLAVQPSTLSTHLAILERAGLVASRRDSRHIFYAAHYEGLRRLVEFLMEDCCQGRPEICGGIASEPSCSTAGCAPTSKTTRRSAMSATIKRKRKVRP
jgi:DNA-binding transcriptional ArsR family regulator